MEKANNMMTDNDMMCWHALYTAPKSEHKLMQRLNAAGYTTYCPMQAVFVKWKGHTRKVITPLFSGCLFVAGNVSEVTSLASSQKADNYFLIYDLPDYVDTKIRANTEYANRKEFGKKCLINIANAGKFSSDRTILQYAKEIWHTSYKK